MKRLAVFMTIIILGLLMAWPVHLSASDNKAAQTTNNEKIIKDDAADFDTADPELTTKEKQSVIEEDQRELGQEEDSDENMDNSMNEKGF